MTVKLNIGAGNTDLDGFEPIDRMFGTEAYPLPHDTDSVDEIRASHILEHFAFGEVPKVLAEWVRVLKPGALIKIAVPDFDKITRMREDPMFLRYIMGGQVDENDFHKSLFTEQALEKEMVSAGLKNITHWPSDNTDTASHPCSLNLQGVKNSVVAGRDAVPLNAEIKIDSVASDAKAGDNSILVKAVCCMSIPRLGWNDHWGCVAEVLLPLSIPIVRFTGAFWGHGMQELFLKARDDGADWIISVDYDSMFSSKHMESMLAMMARHPEIDALACVQTRRGHDYAMLARKTDGSGEHGKVMIDGSPIRCTVAHFGLTIFRTSALKDLPLPWFNAIPGPDGRWDHNERLDDDIFFWKHWEEHGRTLYANPNVRIGHIECMVASMDENYKHQYQTVPEWRKEHTK